MVDRDREQLKAFRNLFRGLGLMLVAVALMMANGYLFSLMWAWYAVTLFHLPPLSTPAAMGLTVLVCWFQFVPREEPDMDLQRIWQVMSMKIGLYFMAWVIHFWVV